jgi:hypothetical protein
MMVVVALQKLSLLVGGSEEEVLHATGCQSHTPRSSRHKMNVRVVHDAKGMCPILIQRLNLAFPGFSSIMAIAPVTLLLLAVASVPPRSLARACSYGR